MNLPKFYLLDVHDEHTAFLVLHTAEPRFVLDPEASEIEWWSEPPDEDDDDFETPLVREAFEFYEASLAKLGG